jgi:hypothetical protein
MRHAVEIDLNTWASVVAHAILLQIYVANDGAAAVLFIQQSTQMK